MAENATETKDGESGENVAARLHRFVIRFLLPCGCVTEDILRDIKHRGIPSWTNRWQCLQCGKFFSR